MIRPVVATEPDSHAVFGLTYRGVALVAAGVAVAFASAVIGALAFGKGATAISRNCHSIVKLARIERVFVDEQQQQTAELLKHGITFGVPRAQLPLLIAASQASQARFLAAFDALHSDC